MSTRVNQAVGRSQPFIDVFPGPIDAQRAPVDGVDVNFPQGQEWFDNSVSPPVQYTFADGANGIWQTGGNAPATTTEYGTVLLTDNSEPVATKAYADALAIAGAPVSTETVAGIGQLATDSEAVLGTASTGALALFVTPSNLAPVFAAPPAIGGTTPGAATFTDLTTSGTVSIVGNPNLTLDANGGSVLIAGTSAISAVVGAMGSSTLWNISAGTIASNSNSGFFVIDNSDINLSSNGTATFSASGLLQVLSNNNTLSVQSGTGALNINTDAAANTTTIGNSTGATSVVINCGTGALNIGTNAIAHTVTIGNGTGASAVVIDSGTGPVNVGTNAVAHTVTIGNVTGATAVNINAGSGGSTLTTTNATLALVSGTGAINVGADAAAKTITIGNVTGATAVNINTGSGGSTITTTNATLALVTGTGAINVGTDAAAKTITVGNSTGATSVVINCGTGALNIGTNAIAHTITIGNITGATAVNVNSGSGACAWTTTNGSFALATGTGAINLGTDAVAKTITIGNVTGATALVMAAGTAASSITTTNGAFAISSGTGAISVSADAAATTINIGTGAAAKTVNLGSTNTTSTTTINSGSGNVNVTGGHLAIASVAKTLLVNGGAVTDFIGTGTLALGTQTIANTNIATGDVILLTRISAGISTTLGELTYSISNGASFTVTSVILGTPGSPQTGDVSTFAYFIVRPT